MASKQKNYTKTKLRCNSVHSNGTRKAKCVKKTQTRDLLQKIQSADVVILKNNDVITKKTVTNKIPLKSLSENELSGLKKILNL